jgi:hypothetical protein
MADHFSLLGAAADAASICDRERQRHLGNAASERWAEVIEKLR